jgi:hypothetical protein
LGINGAAGSFTSPSATVPAVAKTFPVIVKVVGAGEGVTDESPPPHPDMAMYSENKINVMGFLITYLSISLLLKCVSFSAKTDYGQAADHDNTIKEK